MSANNNITIIGYAGADPTTKDINGKIHTRFRVGVRRVGKEAPTDWFEVNVWGKIAETASKYVRKGTLVSVTGSCNIDEWEDKNGGKRITVKIQADHFQMIGPKGDATQQAPAKAAVKAPWEEDDDNIPQF